jgi:hypothetical protein
MGLEKKLNKMHTSKPGCFVESAINESHDSADKLLSERDLCFRVGEEAGGEEWFSGAARRYGGKILEIRHISSCGHGSWKRPLELK